MQRALVAAARANAHRLVRMLARRLLDAPTASHRAKLDVLADAVVAAAGTHSGGAAYAGASLRATFDVCDAFVGGVVLRCTDLDALDALSAAIDANAPVCAIALFARAPRPPPGAPSTLWLGDRAWSTHAVAVPHCIALHRAVWLGRTSLVERALDVDHVRRAFAYDARNVVPRAFADVPAASAVERVAALGALVASVRADAVRAVLTPRAVAAWLHAGGSALDVRALERAVLVLPWSRDEWRRTSA